MTKFLQSAHAADAFTASSRIYSFSLGFPLLTHLSKYIVSHTHTYTRARSQFDADMREAADFSKNLNLFSLLRATRKISYDAINALCS